MLQIISRKEFRKHLSNIFAWRDVIISCLGVTIQCSTPSSPCLEKQNSQCQEVRVCIETRVRSAGSGVWWIRDEILLCNIVRTIWHNARCLHCDERPIWMLSPLNTQVTINITSAFVSWGGPSAQNQTVHTMPNINTEMVIEPEIMSDGSPQW